MENFEPVIISSVPTQNEIQFLDDKIYEHNSIATNRDDGKLFSKSIYNSEEILIAGIAGWTWASACEINLFWVRQDYRTRGYGKALLDAAEAEARKEKCKAIFLRSYSFQAPGFYLKHGYKIEHEIRDFPYGYSSFCLLKRLAS